MTERPAKYCDVVGFDHYEPRFARPELVELLKGLDKPFLNGEFGFAPTYHGKRGFPGRDWGGMITNDQIAGKLYQEWNSDDEQLRSEVLCVTGRMRRLEWIAMLSDTREKRWTIRHH